MAMGNAYVFVDFDGSVIVLELRGVLGHLQHALVRRRVALLALEEVSRLGEEKVVHFQNENYFGHFMFTGQKRYAGRGICSYRLVGLTLICDVPLPCPAAQPVQPISL